MKNYIIVGAPGVGKGTQAKLIAEKYNLVHISSGDLLRKEVLSGSELGKKIESYQARGVFVPDEIVTGLIARSIEMAASGNGFILDGYPRSMEQINILDEILTKTSLKLTAVISLEISEEEALRRMLLRGETSGRVDDNAETIKERFEIYHKETEPVINYYRQRIKSLAIDGVGLVEDIFQNISQKIDEL